MACNPRDMDSFMAVLSTTDIKKKMNVGSLLISYLADESNSIECQDIGMFIDQVIPWLSNGNPRVSWMVFSFLLQAFWCWKLEDFFFGFCNFLWENEKGWAIENWSGCWKNLWVYGEKLRKLYNSWVQCDKFFTFGKVFLFKWFFKLWNEFLTWKWDRMNTWNLKWVLREPSNVWRQIKKSLWKLGTIWRNFYFWKSIFFKSFWDCELNFLQGNETGWALEILCGYLKKLRVCGEKFRKLSRSWVQCDEFFTFGKVFFFRFFLNCEMNFLLGHETGWTLEIWSGCFEDLWVYG